MSIFGTILGKIFSKANPTQPAPVNITIPSPAAQAAAAPANAALSDVDVEAIMDQFAKESKEQLDWRHSIVDLMKLLQIDSSLSARKQLATELKYSGDMNDSASMNIWLHKQLMQALAANGGKLPEQMLH
jgi:hypothetical protein